jgi:thiol-disulfide isomerase/thioredoxin
VRLLVVIAIALGACQGGAASVPGKLELVDAPVATELPPLVARELADARAHGRRLLVYVGASWCEPCRHFHEAAAAGKLDAAFPRVRLLVFDADRDHDALARAGYDSAMIPLFAVPADDGRATGRHIEGSIKGDGAVAEITPRLRALLDN